MSLKWTGLDLCHTKVTFFLGFLCLQSISCSGSSRVSRRGLFDARIKFLPEGGGVFSQLLPDGSDDLSYEASIDSSSDGTVWFLLALFFFFFFFFVLSSASGRMRNHSSSLHKTKDKYISSKYFNISQLCQIERN